MGAAGAEIFVRLRRSIAANHVDLAVRILKGAGEVVQQVEQPRIKVPNNTGAGVAQKVIQLVERREQIGIAAAVYNLQALVGVSVIKVEAVFAGRLASKVPAASAKRRDKHRQQQSCRADLPLHLETLAHAF